MSMPVIPLGVWLGWRLHEGLDQKQLYRLCYGLLAITALKLLWDGVAGIVRQRCRCGKTREGVPAFMMGAVLPSIPSGCWRW